MSETPNSSTHTGKGNGQHPSEAPLEKPDPYADLMSQAIDGPEDYGIAFSTPGTIPTRKPLPDEYIRCHPTFAPKFHIYVDQTIRRSFLVYPHLRPLFGPGSLRGHVLRLFVSALQTPFMWAMPEAIQDSELSMEYARSRDSVAVNAIARWVSCTQERGRYTVHDPKRPDIFPEPKWPAGDANAWLALAWRGAIIDHENHDVLLRKQGAKL